MGLPSSTGEEKKKNKQPLNLWNLLLHKVKPHLGLGEDAITTSSVKYITFIYKPDSKLSIQINWTHFCFDQSSNEMVQDV